MIPHPTQPAWSGPSAGISQTILIKFMECPFRFYLYYWCGLKEKEPPHENLVWGSILHNGLEHLIRGDSIHEAITKMYTYYQEVYPNEPDVTIFTCFEMLKLYNKYELHPYNSWERAKLMTEYEFEQPHSTGTYNVLLRGKMDVTDTIRLCDHKCKGSIYPDEASKELGTDIQMNLYSEVFDTLIWKYDLIRIPINPYFPERRGGESAAAYADRLFNKEYNSKKFFPISSFKPQWLNCVPFYQPTNKRKEFFKKTINPWIDKLCRYWDYLQSPGFDPNNLDCYNEIFYVNSARVFDPSRTDKFKPNFHGILTDQIDYDDLVPVDGFYTELSKCEG